jgi:AmmeMemoRadiSam system protein A
MTSDLDRQRLLRIARDAIVAHISGGSPVGGGSPESVVCHDGLIGRRGGAFVTLHRDGQLRGCVGHIEMEEPLVDVVRRCAVAACSSDPRFPAVAASELPQIALELSLLGPLEPIGGPDQIEIGRHGLVVEGGWHRGLLLPQVATEWNWNARQFLEHTCRKAGLSPDAWKHDAKLWRFEAEVFGDTTDKEDTEVQP